MSTDWTKPEWPAEVMVTINGREYPTQLYDGVQRFVPNMATMAYFDNNFMKGPYDLNAMAVAVVERTIPLDDYIAFIVQTGPSVGYLCDSIESKVQFNPDFFPGEIEDHFDLHNPLWEE